MHYSMLPTKRSLDDRTAVFLTKKSLEGQLFLFLKKSLEERTVVLLTNIDLKLVFWFCAEINQILQFFAKDSEPRRIVTFRVHILATVLSDINTISCHGLSDCCHHVDTRACDDLSLGSTPPCPVFFLFLLHWHISAVQTIQQKSQQESCTTV